MKNENKFIFKKEISLIMEMIITVKIIIEVINNETQTQNHK